VQDKINRTLLLDSREFTAKAPKIDPAADGVRLDKACLGARIGKGYINPLTIENDLVFGTYNDRPLHATQTNKMVVSYETRGIQSLKEENALRIIVQRSRLVPGQTFEGEWLDKGTLTDVQFADTKPLILASGQHRIAALKKVNKTTCDQLHQYLKRNERFLEIEAPSEVDQHEQKALGEEISELKGKLALLGTWGVILYDEGECVSFDQIAHHEIINSWRSVTPLIRRACY
jgi:hypothetical protein